MPYEKTILCLANSRKTSGRCVAGRSLEANGTFGPWVRPVSARDTQEVNFEERHYSDGSEPSLLDVIRIPMLEPRPKGHQQENHLLDPGSYWTKVREASNREVSAVIEAVQGPLWSNEDGSSSNGTNDRVNEARAAQLKRSLHLIRPSNLELVVGVEGGVYAPAKRKVRARFRCGGHQYELAVTDPSITQRYLRGQDGSHPVDEALLCVSLGEVFNGYAYKLVASVILTP